MPDEETIKESITEEITDSFDDVFEEIAGKEQPEEEEEEELAEEPKRKRGRPKKEPEAELVPKEKEKPKEEPKKKTAREEAEEAGGKLLTTFEKQPITVKREEPKKEEKPVVITTEKKPAIEVDFSAEEKEYLEDFPHTKAIVEKMIAKGVESVLAKQEEELGKKGFLGKTDVAPIAQAMITLAMRVEQVSFENSVLRIMPDAPEIIRSDDFKTWAKEQPKSIQLLNNSLDPNDALKLLNYYKEDIARKKVAEHDKTAGEKTKKVIDLMEDTIKQKGRGDKAESIADNFDDAFEEAVATRRKKQ